MRATLRRCYVEGLIVVACLAGASTVLAADASYTPPASVGDIWVVIKYKQTVPGTAQSTDVKVQWGAQSLSKSVSPPICLKDFPQGFVLKMAHKKADSVKLTLTTSGTIVSGPQQGSAPSQWTAKCWSQVVW